MRHEKRCAYIASMTVRPGKHSSSRKKMRPLQASGVHPDCSSPPFQPSPCIARNLCISPSGTSVPKLNHLCHPLVCKTADICCTACKVCNFSTNTLSTMALHFHRSCTTVGNDPDISDSLCKIFAMCTWSTKSFHYLRTSLNMETE